MKRRLRKKGELKAPWLRNQLAWFPSLAHSPRKTEPDPKSSHVRNQKNAAIYTISEQTHNHIRE
jgi:hypothetical protein